ncbi:prepilin peptidase [Candidatus Dojkabacteria bacterium]|uniref:Prepilin peptidase n=1 Tax=Candidatus Dojkabacteria bacterium TaxID=2099670 RepID=A0A5C7J5D3_9BACT|nr:MAG: prepilin peptidase [Candidatus Dojkabacteria bacterium]
MAFFVFILGIVIGSFLNVIIDRIPRGEKITGRSHCESCSKTLKWFDLVPVFSFLLTQGKCRYCHSPLSYQYPIVEILTGVLFLYSFLIFPILLLPFYLFFILIFIVIFFIDLKYGIIPDKIIFPALPIAVIYILLSNQNLLVHILSGILSFSFFYALYLFTRRKGMGFGDVKFALLLGLVLGFPGTIIALYVAFLTGAAVGSILILWKKKKMKSEVPFGPFLVLGCIVTIFFSDQIINLAEKIL